MELFISLTIFGAGLWWSIKHEQDKQKTIKPEYPTIEDIRRKYPKFKPIQTPTDGIYEDFSQELVQVETEVVEIEVSENSFNTLLKLVRRDKELAVNLIRKNMIVGKSATWACEKAIHLIERERGI